MTMNSTCWREQLIGGKTDRASIVRYAIDYIKELLWLVEELKILLVEKKRCGRERHQTEQDGGAGDVSIKLVQTKKFNSLLYVSKLLDELQLDLHHAEGVTLAIPTASCSTPRVYFSFVLMHEGSFLYAKAIDDKLIEVLDGQYAAVPPTSSY
ncbi:unnamed protein product [Prunus armeniaca]|uniref:BHLH domain-containing protein n=1 Tax=Prunus armeniaca TaxID=36596 RepID=A0A6J5TYR2_PRUAR|nr:unnamed protein product [Prunus armeniaca]